VLPIFLNRGREGVVLAVGAVTDIHEIPLIHSIVVHIKNVALFGWFADLTWVGIYHVTIPYYYCVVTVVKISKEASGQQHLPAFFPDYSIYIYTY